jgi:hypothetical protein
LVSWLQQRRVREVVPESTGQYWKLVWLDREPHFEKLHLAQANPTVRPKDASTTFRTPSVWGGAGWPAN